MRNVYNNFIYAELLDSNPLDDIIFYASFNGWHDPMNLKFAKISMTNTIDTFYKTGDVVLINPTKIVFYETNKKVVFRNDAIICGYDDKKKQLAPFNFDVIVKIDDSKNNENFDLLMLYNSLVNQNEVFVGTIFDIYDIDEFSDLLLGDKIVVAQTKTKIDVNKVPFEFKKLSDKNGKYIVTNTRNIIARL